MMRYLENINLQVILNFLVKIFLFLLPWQTIWVYRWGILNDVKWEYGTLGFYGTEILLWLVIFLFIIWYCKRVKFQISNFKFQITRDRIFVFSCLLFIIYHLSSIFWAQDDNLALQQSLRVLEAFLLFFILFLGPLDFKDAVKWFVAGAVSPAVLGIWQFLTQSTFAFKWLGIVSHPVWEAGTSVIQSDTVGRWLRAYGPFNHPNVFGGYLVLTVVLLLLSYKFQVTSYKSKFLFLIPYSLFLIALFFTFSRSAWLILIIGLLVYLFICFKRSCLSLISHLLSFLFLFIILSIIFWPIVSARIFIYSANEIQSVEQRESGYSEALRIFKQHPWLGVGAGNYTLASYKLNSNRPGWEYQPVHNVAVLFVVEQGVVGLALLLFMVVSFIVFLHISDNRYQITDRTKICYLLSVICYLLLACSDHYLYSSYIGLMLTAIFFSLLAENGQKRV